VHPWADDSVVLSVENIDYQLPKAPSPKLRPRACCMRYSLCVMIACLVLALCGRAWHMSPGHVIDTGIDTHSAASSLERHHMTRRALQATSTTTLWALVFGGKRHPMTGRAVFARPYCAAPLPS